MSGRVDALYFLLLAIAVFFTLLIAGLIMMYGITIRRRLPTSIGQMIQAGAALEIAWIVLPSLITAVIVVWGASACFAMSRPPDETLNIYVV